MLTQILPDVNAGRKKKWTLSLSAALLGQVDFLWICIVDPTEGPNK